MNPCIVTLQSMSNSPIDELCLEVVHLGCAIDMASFRMSHLHTPASIFGLVAERGGASVVSDRVWGPWGNRLLVHITNIGHLHSALEDSNSFESTTQL